jgi:hypothetical protein
VDPRGRISFIVMPQQNKLSSPLNSAIMGLAQCNTCLSSDVILEQDIGSHTALRNVLHCTLGFLLSSRVCEYW